MIRSELAIYDLKSCTVRTVLKTEQLIEAPNWTNDGTALIVNGDGYLFRVTLEGEAKLVRLDTGFAVLCNNDHGISPDGKSLVISDSTKHGQSCIYTLPIGGGVPIQVTHNMPSYWHGWSPDGLTLAYCAARDDVYDIYTSGVAGGPETRLTFGKGHSDGPDYTPDGKWIWFNSSQGGTMQLWRMRPDGSDQEQMTHDERVNWFPHPSPDGHHVLYVAYENEVTGHPRDKHIELRMMSPDGGAPTTLLKMFGGQGSINVPCWSPSSDKFAFVRYEPA